ncbi:MAG: hypothetical protein ACE5FR_11470 [Rhodospirillales bacterium]
MADDETPTDQPTTDMAATLGEILHKCEEKGMEPPFIFVGASRNGTVLVMRYRGDGSAGEVLAEHIEDEGAQMPITCMVLDQKDDAVRVTIGAGEVSYD